jgi:hypothetical protein
LFIFFRVKENEPKENARVTRPYGLPCASRKGRAQRNSLALKQALRFLALSCDARRVLKGQVETEPK